MHHLQTAKTSTWIVSQNTQVQEKPFGHLPLTHICPLPSALYAAYLQCTYAEGAIRPLTAPSTFAHVNAGGKLAQVALSTFAVSELVRLLLDGTTTSTTLKEKKRIPLPTRCRPISRCRSVCMRGGHRRIGRSRMLRWNSRCRKFGYRKSAC